MSIAKKIFIIFIFLVSIVKGNAEISDSLFMTIGNKPITKSNIVNEIKILLILNNQSYSDENRDVLHELAVNSVIKRSIKELEIEKNNFLEFNQEDFEKELTRLASNIDMDLDTLKNICESNELDFSLIENQVKTGLLWNSLIFELYKGRIQINAEEINEKLIELQNKKEINEFLISEIIIQLVEKNNFKSEAENLINVIKDSGFENAASNLSISESSKNSGDLGWLKGDVITIEVKSIIENTPVGNLSKPILIDDKIVIFKIRDKRKIKNITNLEDAKNQLINDEKIKILNMHAKSHYDKLRRTVSVKYFQ